MQTAYYIVVISAIGILTAAVIWLVVVLVGLLGKVRKLTEQVSRTIDALDDEIIAAVKSARNTVDDVSGVVSSVRATVQSVGKIASGVESTVVTRVKSSGAVGAVKSSALSLLSIYEGIKQGLRALHC